MAGYTRQSAASIVNGQIIEDSHFNNEFNQLESAFSGSNGHAHDGSEGNGPKINLTTSVTGTLPVANGGTGVTTLQGLNDALTGGTVFKDGSFVIGDSADTTKQFRFEVSAVTTATTRVFTLPDANITISSYMNGLLNTANKTGLQTALDINPTATTNQTDAYLLSRTNHTGKMPLSALDISGSTAFVLGRTGTSGDTSQINISSTASNSTIPIRNSSGLFEVATPTSDSHPATKKYVDDAIDSVVSNPGTVTSVAMSVPTGFSVSGTPVTSSGTLAVTYSAGYQGYTTAEANKLAGIASGAQVNTVTSVAGKTGAVTLSSSDISGLGGAATLNVGTGSGTVAAGNDSRITGALQRSGGTMTGFITLHSNPTSNMHPATKSYVDSAVANVAMVYTGSTQNETNLPIGHTIVLSGSFTRNAAITTPKTNGSNAAYYASGGATGTALSGTWRARGAVQGSAEEYTLAQRTA